MHRALNDNALLADVERLDDAYTIIKAAGVVGATGFAIACVWFLCVAIPAGAL
ncbi:hypothetical protein B0G84_2368 [Paraburkholderia sp. BL8N3]|nr:hypothetical protein [Paraburkholderia sp. BL8N3]TCK44020.1 hypothetical protein B0G84_2368 [Paraburkholderia sp. BL8N3]